MPKRKKISSDYRLGLGCLFAFLLFFGTIMVLDFGLHWTFTGGICGWLGLAAIFVVPLMVGFWIAFRLRPPKPHVEYPENWALLREEVFKRDKYQCQNCGAAGVGLNCHHIVPINKGGTNQLSNLITLCEKCHAKVHPHMTRLEHYRETENMEDDSSYEAGGIEFEEAKKGHRPISGFFNWPGWPGARRH